MRLTITNGSASNPLTLDLTQYIDVQDGSGMDVQDPAFREAVISHSLLKEGGTLALEDLKAKELAFPLRLHATSSSALAILIQQINQVMTSAGALASWQDDGMTQPTYFDLITGQFDIAYSYRQAQQHWTSGKLRLFSQPLGHTAGPRAYAAASGVGPLLMISPYASGGALARGGSTQAGAAGVGGAPGGASSGIFYPGSPSLAGDAGALLQISYAGPYATPSGLPLTIAISQLPDANYRPLTTASQLGGAVITVGVTDRAAVASTYISLAFSAYANMYPTAIASTAAPPLSWAGQHRVFAIARASGQPGWLVTSSNGLVVDGASQTVPVGTQWQLIDVGTMPVTASVGAGRFPPFVYGTAGGASSSALDVTALITLPDAATQYVTPRATGSDVNGLILSADLFNNQYLADDINGNQFTTGNQIPFSTSYATVPQAASPIGLPSAGLCSVTRYTRGLMPRPDPKGGLPILAILGIGTFTGVVAVASNPQNLPATAQVSVLERTRYVLP